jgi:hypothetical protein
MAKVKNKCGQMAVVYNDAGHVNRHQSIFSTSSFLIQLYSIMSGRGKGGKGLGKGGAKRHRKVSRPSMVMTYPSDIAIPM